MARQTKKLIPQVDRLSFEEAFASYNECISKLQVHEGNMNSELTAIKEKYESKISKLQDQRNECFEVMQTYAEATPELFEKKKSFETTFGVVGFRTGTPKLSPRKGFKWAGVFELVKEKFSGYIRVKEEVNKELILADRNNLQLKEMGLEVVQDETFYVEPNLEIVSV